MKFFYRLSFIALCCSYVNCFSQIFLKNDCLKFNKSIVVYLVKTTSKENQTKTQKNIISNK